MIIQQRFLRRLQPHDVATIKKNERTIEYYYIGNSGVLRVAVPTSRPRKLRKICSWFDDYGCWWQIADMPRRQYMTTETMCECLLRIYHRPVRRQ